MDAAVVASNHHNVGRYEAIAAVDYCCDVLLQSRQDGYGYAFNSILEHESSVRIITSSSNAMLYDTINHAKNASDHITSLPQLGRHSGLNNIAYVNRYGNSTRTGSQP